MIDCLQVIGIYSFKKEIKPYIRASYIVFLFVRVPSQPRENLSKVCENSRAGEHSSSLKCSPRFSPGYEGRKNMFSKMLSHQDHEKMTQRTCNPFGTQSSAVLGWQR